MRRLDTQLLSSSSSSSSSLEQSAFLTLSEALRVYTQSAVIDSFIYI